MPTTRVQKFVAVPLVHFVLAASMLSAQATTTAAPTAAPASSTTSTAPESGTFSKEQLEQLVAPIALHPDALLTQILMAATYPVEIVQADRYMRAHPDLKGTALETALKDQDWDNTVKALCTLPDLLKQMSENLDWTQDLGDAFLGQQAELLDTVQRMRGKANDAGNLKTTEQQVVTVQQDKIIVIESKSPEVVYVPTYSPTVVYGPTWGYPSWYYPYWYAPVPYGYGFVAFGVGIAVGAAIWGGCRWGWGRGNVNINVNRYNNFNRNTNINPNRTNRAAGQGGFQHDASHRKGAGYSNSKVASQYGGQTGNRVSGNEARGRSGDAGGSRQARTPSASSQGAGNRTGSAGQGGANRSGTTGSGSSGNRSGSYSGAGSSSRSGSYGGSGSRSGSYGSYGGAYSGSSRPSTSGASSSRGSYSRGTTSYGGGGRSMGGGSRGGGGGRRR